MPPPSLLQACLGPVALPARDATQAEVEAWWRADRARLVTCGEKQAGLAGWARALSGGD